MARPSLLKSNKGQLGILSVVFGLIMFIILWSLWLGGWLAQAGADLVLNNGLTGIEAFLASNLNLWVFVGLILGVLATVYIGGRG